MRRDPLQEEMDALREYQLKKLEKEHQRNLSKQKLCELEKEVISFINGCGCLFVGCLIPIGIVALYLILWILRCFFPKLF